MFWDGSRWIDERAHGAQAPKPRPPHSRHLAAVVTAGLVGLAVLVVPSVRPAEAGYRSAALTEAWGTDYTMDMIQESARAVDARGTWLGRNNTRFLGGRVLTSWRRGSTISATVTGTGIAVIGPTSRHRGRARIAIDGRVVATVTQHSASYHRKVTLYATTWDTEQTHTITITVLGTTRDTKFSVDAFAVRHGKGKGHALPTTEPTYTPAPTVDPTPPPDVPSAAPETPAPTAATDPLVISGVFASDVTATTARITWTVSAPATGQVEYGTSGAYGQTSTLERSFDWSTHVQGLSGLTPGTRYHFRTHSVAADGRSVYSDDETFDTAPSAASATTAPTPTPASTQTPAPTATATPVATPVATATPRPTTTPTPAPTTVQGLIAVPSSIDATGLTDVTAALNTWIRSVPDGSTIQFQAGGTYLLSQGIQFAGRHNLTFDGNGATLRTTGSGSSQLASLFVIGHGYGGAWSEGNTNIAVRNFTLVGNDPTPGTFGGGEAQAGMEIEGVAGLSVSNVTVRAVYGDGFKIGDGSSGILIANSRVESAGRNGVSVISASNVVVRDSRFDRVGYVTFDVEPNTSSQGSDDLVFRNNTAGTWDAEFFALDGSHTGASINNVTVTGNTVTGRSLLSYVDNGNTARNRDIVFTGNSSSVTAAGPVLVFRHVDGLTVTGNTQPLSSGALASITDCSSVAYP